MQTGTRQTIAVALCVSSCLALFGGCVRYQGPEPDASVVRGNVVYFPGANEGVRVSLDGTTQEAITDAQGRFILRGVAPGHRRMILTHGTHAAVFPLHVPPRSVVEARDLAFPRDTQHAPTSTAAREPATPLRERLELESLAAESGVSVELLRELVEASGADTEVWRQFLRTGRLPGSARDLAWSRKDILRITYAFRDRLSIDDAKAILMAATGFDPASMRAWLHRHRNALPRNADGSLSAETLAAGFRLLAAENELAEDFSTQRLARNASSNRTNEIGRGTYVLYRGDRRTPPQEQDWWYLTDPLNSRVVQTTEAGSVVLDTMARREDKGGYFTEDPVSGALFRHPRLPVLDRQVGFTVLFDVAIRAEAHVREDRAGFSLLVVCDDLSAIELGFWEGRVWAQRDDGRPLFQGSRGEGRAYQGTRSLARYALQIAGARYTLYANGSALLEGPLRDYAAFGRFPYTVPNFLFLGDNTTSARALLQLAYVAVTVHDPPEEQRGPARGTPAGVAGAAGDAPGRRPAMRREGGRGHSRSGGAQTRVPRVYTPAHERTTVESEPGESGAFDVPARRDRGGLP